MAPLKSAISKLLRLPFKHQRQSPRSCDAALLSNSTIPYEAADELYHLAHSVDESNAESLTDSGEKDVREFQELGGEGGLDDQDAGGDDSGDLEAGVEEHDVNVDLDEDEDANADGNMVSDLFPFELAHKTCLEKMLYRVYIALSDDEEEISSLRTHQGLPFTHIIRLSFVPHSDIKPSSWTMEVKDVGAPFGVHLKCPQIARKMEGNTAMRSYQILRTCDFMKVSLPYEPEHLLPGGKKIKRSRKNGDDSKFPFSCGNVDKGRLLIVGPTDRPIDVMSIFLSYFCLLGSKWTASTMIAATRRISLTHPMWRDHMTRAAVWAVTEADWQVSAA